MGKQQIIKKAQADYDKTKNKGLKQIAKIKDPKEKQIKQKELNKTLDKIHNKADAARGTKTYTLQAKRPGASVKYVQVAEKQPVQGATKKLQPLPKQTTQRFGVNPNQQKRQLSKDRNQRILVKETKDSATARGVAGFISGFSPTKAKFTPNVQKNLKDSKAFKAGEYAGIVAQFAATRGGAGGGVVSATTKLAPRLLPALGKVGAKGVQRLLPKVGEEAAKKFGKSAAESLVKDIVIGAPLNVNYAINKEGLKGKEAAKSIALNTGLDIATGGVMEVVPAIAKGLKKGEKIPVIKNGKVKYEVKPAEKLPSKAENIEPLKQIQKVQQPRGIKTLPRSVQEIPQTIQDIKNQAIEPQKTDLGTITPNPKELPRFKDLGADTNKTLPTYKLSKLRTNTMENSPMFDGTRHEMPETDYMYEARPERVTLAEAKQRLETDFHGEVEDLFKKTTYDGADTDTAMGIAKRYALDAEQTGDYRQLKEWSKSIREKATEQGQAIQAFAKYARTPEGKVVEGQRTVSQVEKSIKENNPNLINKVNEETKAVKAIITDAEKDTANSLGEILSGQLEQIGAKKKKIPTPAELLAKKISSTAKERKTKEPDFINDMVNELFRSAKESPLPERVAAAKRNPIEYLTQALRNKGQYTDVWNEAKAIIKDKYADSPDVLDMLDDYFEKGIIPPYSKTTLKNSLNKSVKQLGIDLNKIIKTSKGNRDKTLADITEYLIKETGAVGDDAKMLADNLMAEYDTILKAKTESALKQMLREVPKRGQKSTYEKVMELINMGAYDDEALKDLIKAKNNIPVLENGDIKGILENMKLSEQSTDPYMKRMYEARAQKIISDKVPAEFMEQFAGLQRMSMLINPKTLITRNPLGNTILGVAENLKDIPGTAVDKLVSLKTGQRTTTMNPQLGAQLSGFKQGLGEWAKDIKYGVDTSPTRAQFELPNKRLYQNELLNASDRFLGNALQLGDRPFYQAAYNGRIAELKKLGVTGEKAEEQARLFALDRVFQNNSVLSERALAIRNKLGIFGRLVMPFAQTPANIMDKLLDYSPVGMAKAVSQLGTIGKGTFDQKLFVDRIGRTLTGTGIAILGYAMAKNGLLTGNTYDPTNKDKNAALTLAGKQGYSIKIGDKWHSYDFAQPIGGILAAAADAYNAGAEGKDFISSLGVGSIAAVNTVFNQSFMSGLLEAFSGYSPAEGIGGSLLSSTSQVTPTVLNNITKTIDPYARETYDPNMFKQQGNKLLARIPFASKTLPKKLDVTGKPIKLNQGRGLGSRLTENFIAPQKISQVKHDKVNDEALRLSNKTGSNGVLLNQAEKKISRGGASYTLTPKEYQQYQKEMGQNAYKQIDKLINSKKYQNMKSSEKVEALENINEEAKHQAQNNILLKRGVIDELVDMSSKQREGYKAIAKDVTKKEYADAYYSQKKLGKDYQRDLYKAMRITKANPQKANNISSALGYSPGTIDRANKLVANNVGIKQFDSISKRADTNGNKSITKAEAIQALNKTDLAQAQKRAAFMAMCPSVKRVPF